MVGGLPCVVIHVKCDPNRLRGYGAVGVENGPSLLLWPVAYTTGCTTVQAVMTLTDPKPGFQGHFIFEVEYLKNVTGWLAVCHTPVLCAIHIVSCQRSEM